MPNIPDIQFTPITSEDLRDSDYLRLFRQLEPVKVQGFKLRTEELLKLTGQSEPEKVFRYPFEGKYIKWPHIFISILKVIPGDYVELTKKLCILDEPTEAEIQDFLSTQPAYFNQWAQAGADELCGSNDNISNIRYAIEQTADKVLQIKDELRIAQDYDADQFNVFQAAIIEARSNIISDGEDASLLYQQQLDCQDKEAIRLQIYGERDERLDVLWNYYNTLIEEIDNLRNLCAI